ncbi:Ecl1 domain protein [Rhizoctonia solani]|uniref:Ecl1 domain protein n=2 Tax=Rhizoctonia solani TaxID=456999 RepID=A0A8H8NTQ7_9AGAM|nr:Ecl1 domain protein [Rhizoctonia solani]QRW18450.1 Ecl1 domain protein [Rhizoctonia solani]
MTSFLSIPPELLIEVLLNVEEPWAIHHTNRLLLTISEDEHYLYLRDIRLPPSLVIWNAIRRRGVGLSPEYLQRLIDGGALVPFSFAQLLTNPRIPRPAPARALHKLLQSLQPMTKALLVGAHMKPITAALTHDDDQRVFEALFGAPTVRNVRGAAKALFDHRAFVPYSLGDETDVGSLHGAFTSAFESYAKGNESPLDALLESETVCTLIKTDERDLKSHVLVEAFAIVGSELGSRLLRHDAFWRPRVNIVEALLRLNSSEASLARFMEIATTRSTPFPPTNGRMSGLDYTPEAIMHALSSKLSQKISPEWFIKHHKSLGRIYSYFTSFNPSLCDQLDSLAQTTLENVFRPSAVSEHHDSSMLWSFYSQFGGSTKENIVREVRGKVKELVYGNPHPPYTFSEWGACLYLIAQLDVEAREKILSGLINSKHIGNTQAQTIEVGLAADEEGALWLGEAKKRMQRFGIPLVMFGLA